MTIGYDPQTDPIADLLRRATAGDEAAKAEFYAERAARAQAHREFQRMAHANARAMIRRACTGDTTSAAASPNNQEGGES